MARDRGAIEGLQRPSVYNLVCIFRAEIDSWCGPGDRSRELYAAAIMLMRITKITRRVSVPHGACAGYIFRAFFRLSSLCTTLHDVSS